MKRMLPLFLTLSLLSASLPVSAAENAAQVQLEYDTTPMQVGEVRAIRYWSDADPDRILTNAHSTPLSDDFKSFQQRDENVVYVTALRPGEVKLCVWDNTAQESDTISIPITAATGKSVQRLGYINEDADVNASDAADILLESVRIGTNSEHHLKGTKLAAADVNFDGAVNAIDANLILIYAAVRGTHPDVPDFPEYIAMQYADPDPGLFLTLPQFMSGINTLTMDDGAWKDFPDDTHGITNKYRIFTSAEEFTAYAAALAEHDYGKFNDGKVDITELAVQFERSKHFDKHALIAVASGEPCSNFRYALGDVTARADIGWEIQLIRKVPASGAAMGCGTLTLLMVDKAVEYAQDVKIEFADADYDPDISIPFSAYVRLCSHTEKPESVMITSHEQLTSVFGDIDKKGWTMEGDPDNKEQYSLRNISTMFDGDYFAEMSLLHLCEKAAPGFYDLHIADVGFDKTTGELIVTAKRLSAPHDVMGEPETWNMIIQIDKETADQVKSFRVICQ